MASESTIIATWIVILLLAAVIIYLVVRASRQTSNLSEYALGSMAFSPVAVGLSLAASVTSAATFIINPGFIALYGLSGVLALGIVLPLGLFLSLIILTKSFRKHGQHVQALTMAQWIGKRFGSQGFAMFFGFLSLLLITFIVLICVGLTKVLASSLNAPEGAVLVILVVFVFGYMMFGGANSMVYTNMIQALLMIVVAVILLGSGYEHFSGGVKTFLAKLEAIDPLLTTPTNPESPLFRDYFEVIFCNFIIGIAVVCQPHIITKSLLLKKESDVNRYLLVSIVVEMLFFLVIFAGLYARISFPDLQLDGTAIPMDGIISAYVVQEFPVYLGIILILGLISAGLSTLEGLLQTVPTSLNLDIMVPLLGDRLGVGEEKEKNIIRLNKLLIIFVAGLSLALSWQQLVDPDLSVGIFAQNGVYAYFSAAFVPVLLGIFFKNVPAIAPIAASVTAIVVHFSVYYGRLGSHMEAPVRNPAIAATFAILAAVAVGFSLYFLSPRRQKSIAI